MWRHTQSNNLCFLAVLLEVKGVMALMAVNKEQLVPSLGAPLCIGIKVLQLVQTKLVGSPSILRDSNNPVLGQIRLLVLGREVVAAFEDDEGWNGPSCSIDALYDCCPLPAALLHCLSPSSTL